VAWRKLNQEYCAAPSQRRGREEGQSGEKAKNQNINVVERDSRGGKKIRSRRKCSRGTSRKTTNIFRQQNPKRREKGWGTEKNGGGQIQTPLRGGGSQSSRKEEKEAGQSGEKKRLGGGPIPGRMILP